jgi:glycosyltransferase involved in cell wall biosynthesis
VSKYLGAVVLPTLGNPAFINRCLESICADNYSRKIRIYVIHNAQEKISESTLKLLRPHDAFIEASNLNSISKCLNLGIDTVEEDLIFRMDDDDLWHQNRFMIQFSEFERGNELILGSARFRSIRGLPMPQGRLTNSNHFDPFLLLLGNYILHPAIAMSTSLIRKIRYRETASEDYDLWLRVFQTDLKWTTTQRVITYTSRRSSLTNQLKTKEEIMPVFGSFKNFSGKYDLPSIDLGEFLKLTGQGCSPDLNPLRGDGATNLIEYLVSLKSLNSCKSVNDRLFFDHVFTIMMRNPVLIPELLQRLGWNSAYVSGLFRRSIREILK